MCGKRIATMWVLVTLGLGAAGAAALGEDEPELFSGPQPGEPLMPLTVRGVYDDLEGRDVDLLAAAGRRPVFWIFVHEANRPSIGLTRAVMNFAAARHGDVVHAAVVFLTDDVTDASGFLQRARHAMPADVPLAISLDGQEGPGTYGLNRDVTLTVLIAQDHRVTDNFALVQPSLQADAPRILAALTQRLGGEPLTLDELNRALAAGGAMYAEPAGPDARLRALLAPVIRPEASSEQVDEAAAELLAYLRQRPQTQQQVGQIARRIIASGRLADYGTDRAQYYLEQWAEMFPQAPEDAPARMD